MDLYHTYYITFWRHRGSKYTEPTPEWIRYRLRFLCERTLRSLTFQRRTSPVLIYVAPDVRDLVLRTMESEGLRLPSIARFTNTSPRKDLAQYRESHDVVAITRIDSDDLFHQDVGKEISGIPDLDRWGLLVYRVGFAVNLEHGWIDRYIHHCPPFYTVVLRKGDGEPDDPIQVGNHMKMMASMDPRKVRPLPAGRFVVMAHGTQDTSTWEKLRQQAAANTHKLRASDLVPFPETLEAFGAPDITVHRENFSER